MASDIASLGAPNSNMAQHEAVNVEREPQRREEEILQISDVRPRQNLKERGAELEEDWSLHHVESFAAAYLQHEVLFSRPPRAVVDGDQLVSAEQAHALSRQFALGRLAGTLRLPNDHAVRARCREFRHRALCYVRWCVRTCAARGEPLEDALVDAPLHIAQLAAKLDLLKVATLAELSTRGGPVRRRAADRLSAALARASRPRRGMPLPGRTCLTLPGGRLPACPDARPVPEELWERLCEVRLRQSAALSTAGDHLHALPRAARPRPVDWRLINSLLCMAYELDARLVNPESLFVCEELRSLTLLSRLMAAAHEEGFEMRADLWSTVHAHYNATGRTASLMMLQRRWMQLVCLASGPARPPRPPLLVYLEKCFPEMVFLTPGNWRLLLYHGLVVHHTRPPPPGIVLQYDATELESLKTLEAINEYISNDLRVEWRMHLVGMLWRPYEVGSFEPATNGARSPGGRSSDEDAPADLAASAADDDALADPVAGAADGDALADPVAGDAVGDALADPVASAAVGDALADPIASAAVGDALADPVAGAADGDAPANPVPSAADGDSGSEGNDAVVIDCSESEKADSPPAYVEIEIDTSKNYCAAEVIDVDGDESGDDVQIVESPTRELSNPKQSRFSALLAKVRARRLGETVAHRAQARSGRVDARRAGLLAPPAVTVEILSDSGTDSEREIDPVTKHTYDAASLNPDLNPRLKQLTEKFVRRAENRRLMSACRPATVRVRRLRASEMPLQARVVKKVELADIEEVRRINSGILTAQVGPLAPAPPGAGDSDSSSCSGASDGECDEDDTWAVLARDARSVRSALKQLFAAPPDELAHLIKQAINGDEADDGVETWHDHERRYRAWLRARERERDGQRGSARRRVISCDWDGARERAAASDAAASDAAASDAAASDAAASYAAARDAVASDSAAQAEAERRKLLYLEEQKKAQRPATADDLDDVLRCTIIKRPAAGRGPETDVATRPYLVRADEQLMATGDQATPVITDICSLAAPAAQDPKEKSISSRLAQPTLEVWPQGAVRGPRAKRGGMRGRRVVPVPHSVARLPPDEPRQDPAQASLTPALVTVPHCSTVTLGKTSDASDGAQTVATITKTAVAPPSQPAATLLNPSLASASLVHSLTTTSLANMSTVVLATPALVAAPLAVVTTGPLLNSLAPSYALAPQQVLQGLVPMTGDINIIGCRNANGAPGDQTFDDAGDAQWEEPGRVQPPSALTVQSPMSAASYMAYFRCNILTLVQLDSAQPLWTIADRYLILAERPLPCVQPTYWTLGPPERCRRIVWPANEITRPSPRETVGEGGPGPVIGGVIGNYEAGAGVRLGRNVVESLATEASGGRAKLKVKSFARSVEKNILEVRGPPELLQIGEVYYKKLTEQPVVYARLLSAVSSTAECDGLLRARAPLLVWERGAGEADALCPLDAGGAGALAGDAGPAGVDVRGALLVRHSDARFLRDMAGKFQQLNAEPRDNQLYVFAPPAGTLLVAPSHTG